jgi:hypothetical protein
MYFLSFLFSSPILPSNPLSSTFAEQIHLFRLRNYTSAVKVKLKFRFELIFASQFIGGCVDSVS